MKNRKAFNFYRSYYEVALELPEKERLEFLMALLTVQFTGQETVLTGMAKFAYLSQKHSIDAQIQGFIHKSGATPIQPPITPPCQGATEGATETPSVQEKEKGKEEGQEKGEGQGAETAFDKFKNQLIADAKQNENSTAAGQERTGQKETQTGVSQTNTIHTAAEHRKRLNETASQMENLRRAMIAGCGGGTPADLKALIDLADARFDAAHSGGAIYSRYLQYVTSCITNERKLPGKGANNQQAAPTTATRLKKRNTES
jgi:hypothetical protein